MPESRISTILRWYPHRDVRRLMAISDLMARRSREIVEEKRRLLLEGDEALLQQVGAGKDLMSILRESNYPTRSHPALLSVLSQ